MSWKLDLQNTFVCGVQRATGRISPAIIYSLGPNAGNGWGEKRRAQQSRRNTLLLSRLPEECALNARCVSYLVGL